MKGTNITNGRQKSGRLTTTTPSTTVGKALLDIKSSINPHFYEGVPIMKVSSKGTLVPRIITISDDLFTIFISHDKMTKESLKNRVKYRGYKAYTKFVNTLVGHSVQCHRDIRVIDVADILFVQSGFIGSQKLEFCKMKMKFDSSQVVSIFHNDKSIDFLIRNLEVRVALLRSVELIRRTYHESKMKLGRERKMLRYICNSQYNNTVVSDWDKSGMICESEFLYLLIRINVYIKKEIACKLFLEAASKQHPAPLHNTTPEITFNQCIELLRKIKREQLNGNQVRDYIFDSVFGADREEVTIEEFLNKFLRAKQKEHDASIDDVNFIFAELHGMEILRAHHEDSKRSSCNTIDRLLFEEYLMLGLNDAYDPRKREFDPNSLDEPISHYWINTSHNTYLTGDQLKSYSSVQMYVSALQSGCKCLELDCWDDSTAQIPVVYHGYTLTSQIPFNDIILVVKCYVESNPSGLPIILSLENHCSAIYQRQMAAILKSTLGKMLYIPDKKCDVLPSPNELIGKVVLKGKRPPETEDIEEMKESSRALGVKEISNDATSAQTVTTFVEDLGKLTLLNGVSFKDFAMSVTLPCTDMHSFSETKIATVLKNPNNTALWREYNRDHMTRTYPSGSRVDSSNAKPLVAWATGCQLVALNYQTHDAALVINDGRFRENGGCGYIRKPDSILTSSSEDLDQEITLSIRVLSGTCLPKPKAEKVGEVISPYVVIRAYDVALDECDPIRGSLRKELLDRAERKTEEILDNGYCPQWDSEAFSFQLKSRDVGMISFYVSDSDAGFLDDTMCKVAIPVNCLREGFRNVQFYDATNSQCGPFEFASILVEINIKPNG